MGLQPIVTLSSCEAEYVALCAAVCEVKYISSLMRDLGYAQRDASIIWEDNKAAILIAENECSSAGRSKHIDVKFKFVAQNVAAWVGVQDMGGFLRWARLALGCVDEVPRQGSPWCPSRTAVQGRQHRQLVPSQEPV